MQRELAQRLTSYTSVLKGEEEELPRLHSGLFKSHYNSRQGLALPEPHPASEHSSRWASTTTHVSEPPGSPSACGMAIAIPPIASQLQPHWCSCPLATPTSASPTPASPHQISGPEATNDPQRSTHRVEDLPAALTGETSAPLPSAGVRCGHQLLELERCTVA